MEKPKYTCMNPFDYRLLIKSEPEAFRELGVREYQANEIQVRTISSRASGLMFGIGTACLFGEALWWKVIGGIMIQIAVCLFFYRRGHLNGYVWGHQVGFEGGVCKALDIDDGTRAKLYEEMIELQT